MNFSEEPVEGDRITEAIQAVATLFSFAIAFMHPEFESCQSVWLGENRTCHC
ncbi:MAG: hypothetical protein KME25_03065 [Symplocastrum torsivum CPER-KK1]|uniref:Uncharacterized protein n=1 Tax=Symplocastrum torsivum CPER-KK1 TaxID=450513 RepID=A0A951U811_9CYAN|nr:hypothetical protein [Symplocastrum torsivum CPER-KK1]